MRIVVIADKLICKVSLGAVVAPEAVPYRGNNDRKRFAPQACEQILVRIRAFPTRSEVLTPGAFAQFSVLVSWANSRTWMPRPRIPSSLKYGTGSNAISGGMTPTCLTLPFDSHWAATEGGMPVSTTPPPTFHFLWGHVTAS